MRRLQVQVLPLLFRLTNVVLFMAALSVYPKNPLGLVIKYSIIRPENSTIKNIVININNKAL